MKIVFVSDTFHHHQKGVADALNNLTKGSYRFITTAPLREERKKMGFDNIYPDYVFDASSRTPELWNEAQRIIDEADVVVLGSAPYKLLRNRLSEGKLTFRYSEHVWKKIKHYLKTPFYILDNIKTRGCRLLCASAFAAHDYNAMGAFNEVCYKWGYFPDISPSKNDEEIFQKVKNISDGHIRLMWCSRFLKWKHPELVIYLAKQLKEIDLSFELQMYGSGKYFDASVDLAKKLGVEDCVIFKGNASNNEILYSMRSSDIFLFTSDRGEGWGVVANESMGNGCCLVASDEIGSIPYLVQDMQNGCTFKSSRRCYGFSKLGVSIDKEALQSLTENVIWLIEHPEERKRLSSNALKTMLDTWSPRKAAENLLTLIEDIQKGHESSIEVGPCSKA